MLLSIRQRFHRNKKKRTPILVQSNGASLSVNGKRKFRDELSCHQCGVLTHTFVMVRFRKKKVPLNNEFVEDGVCQICKENSKICATSIQSKDDDWYSNSLVSDITLIHALKHQDDLSLVYSYASDKDDKKEQDATSVWSYNTFGRTNDACLDEYFDLESVITFKSKVHSSSLLSAMDHLPSSDIASSSDGSIDTSDEALLFTHQEKAMESSSCDTSTTRASTRNTTEETNCSSGSIVTASSEECFNNKRSDIASANNSFFIDRGTSRDSLNKLEAKRVQFSELFITTPNHDRVRSLMLPKLSSSLHNSRDIAPETTFQLNTANENIKIIIDTALNDIQTSSNLLEISMTMADNSSYPLVIEIACARIRETSAYIENENISYCDRIATAKNIVSSMLTTRNCQDVHGQACMTVAYLCKRNIWREVFEEDFCIRALLCSLDDHINSEVVSCSVLDALVCLATRSALVVNSITRQQGTRLILKTLRRHYRSLSIAEHCSEVINILSKNTLSIQDLSMANNLVTLKICLTEHSRSIRIVELTLGIIYHVAKIGISLDNVLLEIVFELSTIHDYYASTQILVCKIMHSLAVSSCQNKAQISRDGGIQILREMVQKFGSESIKEEVICCFRAISMTKDVEVKRNLAKSDIIDAILTVVDDYPLNERIQSNGLSTIEALVGFVDYSIQVSSL